jgi:hypothetical protein
MKKVITIISSLIILALIVIIGINIYSNQNTLSLGSINGYDAYKSTTTPSISSTILMLKTGQGVVGSVVIGVTSNTTFELRNATSTTDTASTTLLSMSASPAIGSTLTLDVGFDRGLSMVFPASFVGRYTVTYK